MISDAKTVDIARTQELDRLAQQATQLFVEEKPEQKASRGIWDSLPVDVIRALPTVVPAAPIELPQKTVTNYHETTSSSVRARKPMPVPSSRKLESSIHATSPVVKNNKYASKRAGTKKASIGAGMGCDDRAVSMRGVGKLEGAEETMVRGVSVRKQMSSNEFNVSGIFARTIFQSLLISV